VCVQDLEKGGAAYELLAPTDDATLQAGSAKDALLGQPAVRLPWIVRVLNLVLFGDGRFCVVPLLLGGTTCSFWLFWASKSSYWWVNDTGMPPSTISVWVNLAVAAETAVNTYFGFRFCCAGRVMQLAREVGEPHGVIECDAMRVLGRGAWAAAAASVAFVGWAVVVGMGYGTGESKLALIVANAIANTITLSAVTYLCALWLWTNWLFWRAGRSIVARDITVLSVAQRRAGGAVFRLLDAMRLVSQVWSVNHAVRTVTMVVWAVTLELSAREFPDWAGVNWAWFALIIAVVLVTAAVPGYVTTDFYEGVLNKLAEIAHADVDADAQRGELQEPRDMAPTALMQRVAAARAGKGMHFAGVPMTVEKAVTVATVVFTVTKFFAATGR
jgi:hypothetical protein